MRVSCDEAGTPLGCTGMQVSAEMRPLASSKAWARVCVSRRAPLSSAAGIVVTSIDCLALVGQPIPQEPRFQHPLTLRWMIDAGMPSAVAPRRNRSLFSFGAVSHGVMLSRRSACANQGASASSVRSANAKRSRQNTSVGGGVRNELVQLTVVEPPTQRPCRMVIALSAVLRAALSWYRLG